LSPKQKQKKQPAVVATPVPGISVPPVLIPPVVIPQHKTPEDKRTEEKLSEICRSLRVLEDRVTNGAVRTLERGVETRDERRGQLILMRTECVRIERHTDEEKEKLKRDLAQARRDNAALYILLEGRGNGERAPEQVKMPEIPRLDLSAGEKRRVKRETAEKLRRLEDVLPRGFILQEIDHTGRS
jgi:hypothetical protein